MLKFVEMRERRSRDHEMLNVLRVETIDSSQKKDKLKKCGVIFIS